MICSSVYKDAGMKGVQGSAFIFNCSYIIHCLQCMVSWNKTYPLFTMPILCYHHHNKYITDTQPEHDSE